MVFYHSKLEKGKISAKKDPQINPKGFFFSLNACRTLFNDLEPEPKFESNIESNSNYNLNSNSENEPESVKEKPQPYQSDKIAAPPPYHLLMDPNLTLDHLHGYNFLSHLCNVCQHCYL